MKLVQMEYFLKVADHLSYTIAAKELYISQPALSKQITLLENDLGIKLFYRNNKRVELTDAGKKLATEIRPLLNSMMAVIDEVKGLSTKHRQIHIGCFDGLEVESVIDKIEMAFKSAGTLTVDITLEDITGLKKHLLLLTTVWLPVQLTYLPKTYAGRK